jgi:hypothetical protein
VDRLLAARPASLTRQRVRMIVDVDPLFLL